MSDMPRNPEFGEVLPEVAARKFEVLQSAYDVAHIPEVSHTRAQLYLVPEQHDQADVQPPEEEITTPREDINVIPFPGRPAEPQEEGTPAADNDLDQEAIKEQVAKSYGQQEAA
jgi:hypothetical protein